MKNTFKIFVALIALVVVFSCNRQDDKPVENPNIIKEDDPNLGFSVFQYTNLYKAIGMNEGEFKKKLDVEKISVTFNEGEYEYSYYAKNDNAPYKNYLIRYVEDNTIDYTTKPDPTRYPGLAKIIMTPVDENKNPVKIEPTDLDKIYKYFYEKANPLEPTKKPYELILYNRFAGPKGYFEYPKDFETFLTEIKNPQKQVHGRITWNNNFDSKIFGPSASATVEKNTHIQTISYDYQKKIVEVQIEVNLPLDFYKLKWR